MINYLAKQTMQTIPTNGEQMSRFWKVGMRQKKKQKKTTTRSLLLPTLAPSVFTVRHLIFTHTPGQV